MAQAGNEGIPNTKTIDPKAGSKVLEKVRKNCGQTYHNLRKLRR